MSDSKSITSDRKCECTKNADDGINSQASTDKVGVEHARPYWTLQTE